MSSSTRFTCQNVMEYMGQPMSFAEERQWREHVESCPECMAKIEATLSSSTIVDELRYLVPDPIDHDYEGNIGWSSHDFVVDYLEPAHDPANLGSLGAHYDIVEIIGHGGMGVVMKAFDRELKRYVAIKALSPNLASNPIARRRFARESQSVAAVVHPNVIQIHSVEASGRLPFLVMSLVAGESLADRLSRQGAFELKETLQIGIQIAAGLAAAHDRGLVHRDIKPSNILLEKSVGRAVLTDFGLARSVDDLSLTRTISIAGTPEYISPEAANGQSVDRRSDLFSLGCVLYALASGVSPFRADTMFAVLRQVSECAPQPLASFCSHLPAWFTTLVHRLLEKSPDDRIQTAHEVVELLEAGLAHLQQPNVHKSPAVQSTHRANCEAKTTVSSRRTSLAIRATAAGTVVATILLLVFYLDKRERLSGIGAQPPVAESPESRLASTLEKLKAAGAKLTERHDMVVMVDFSGTRVTEELMQSLKDIPSLRAVGIRQANFPSSWYRYIPEPVFRLDITEMKLSSEDCVALSKLTHLKWLGFIRSELPAKGIQTVCSSTVIELFSVQETLIDDAAVQWLVKNQALQGLDLNGNPYLSADVIATVSHMKSLTTLHLCDTQVDDAAIEQIAANLKLKELGLCRCANLTDKALESLAQCKTLEAIYLDSTQVSEEGLLKLAALPNLSKLVLRDNAVDKQRVQQKLGSHVVVVTSW